jgi:hypothetical protein
MSPGLLLISAHGWPWHRVVRLRAGLVIARCATEVAHGGAHHGISSIGLTPTPTASSTLKPTLLLRATRRWRAYL